MENLHNLTVQEERERRETKMDEFAHELHTISENIMESVKCKLIVKHVDLDFLHKAKPQDKPLNTEFGTGYAIVLYDVMGKFQGLVGIDRCTYDIMYYGGDVYSDVLDKIIDAVKLIIEK